MTLRDLTTAVVAAGSLIAAATQFISAVKWEDQAYLEENKRLDALETVRARYETSLDLCHERLQECENDSGPD